MFDPKLYREACRELTAPEDKIEEVIAMTEQTNKKKRRPLRAALICAAAVAMMVVGVSAANPEMIEAVAGRIIDIIQVNQYKMELITDNGKVTVYSAPQATVENRDGRAILVIDGEDVGDITDELNAEGRYCYEGVTGENGESRLTVTVEGTAEEWTASVMIEDPDGPISESINYAGNEGSRFSEITSTFVETPKTFTETPNSPATFTETVDGIDVYVSITEHDSETGEPIPEN